MGHMYVRCTSPTLLPLCVCVCAPREEVSRGEGQRMDALSQVAEQLGRPTEEVCLHLLVCVCVCSQGGGESRGGTADGCTQSGGRAVGTAH